MTAAGKSARQGLPPWSLGLAGLAFVTVLCLASQPSAAHERASEAAGLLTSEEIDRALAAAERLARAERDEDGRPPAAPLTPSEPATRLVDWLIAVAALDERSNLLRFREALGGLGYAEGGEGYQMWREHMKRLLLAFDAERKLAASVDLAAAEAELMAMPTALEQEDARARTGRYLYEMTLSAVLLEDRDAVAPFAERIAALLSAAQQRGP